MAESTKERIINAAFSFYKVPNFERVSLSQIAGRVGISKAAIFKHFKNKEALTQEMNNRIFESLIQVFEPMTVLYNQDRPGEAISYIVKFLITHREYLVYLLSMSIMFNENFVVNELRNRGVEIFDNVFAVLLSAIGTCFLIYYIFRASDNVIASDYIRIVNYYLKDVKDLYGYLFPY